jgi:hypothetical protein
MLYENSNIVNSLKLELETHETTMVSARWSAAAAAMAKMVNGNNRSNTHSY